MTLLLVSTFAVFWIHTLLWMFRGFIENNAKKLDIKGYVFNDVDGSVKIACEGVAKSIDTFINGLTGFARLEIDSIEKKQVHE